MGQLGVEQEEGQEVEWLGEEGLELGQSLQEQVRLGQLVRPALGQVEQEAEVP